MVVFITGATSGLGKYTAREFLKRGHKVYGTGRSVENEEKDGINFVKLDVCSEESCMAAIAYVIGREGRIDVLVNNAGFGVAGAVEFTSDTEAKAQFETNFFGILNMYRAVLPEMRKEKAGRIINISSVAAAMPIPFQAMYSAGKAAVETVSHAASMELEPYGISFVSIEFGDMKTGFTGNRKTAEKAEDDEKVYKEVFERSIKRMERDEESGPLPDKAARLIVRAAAKKRSKPLIVCGFKYKIIVMMRRFLPIGLTNKLIKIFYAN